MLSPENHHPLNFVMLGLLLRYNKDAIIIWKDEAHLFYLLMQVML